MVFSLHDPFENPLRERLSVVKLKHLRNKASRLSQTNSIF